MMNRTQKTSRLPQMNYSDPKGGRGGAVSTRSFDILNSIIYWSRCSIDFTIWKTVLHSSLDDFVCWNCSLWQYLLDRQLFYQWKLKCNSVEGVLGNWPSSLIHEPTTNLFLNADAGKRQFLISMVKLLSWSSNKWQTLETLPLTN